MSSGFTIHEKLKNCRCSRNRAAELLCACLWRRQLTASSFFLGRGAHRFSFAVSTFALERSFCGGSRARRGRGRPGSFSRGLWLRVPFLGDRTCPFFRLSGSAVWTVLDSICFRFRCAGGCPPLFVSRALLLCARPSFWLASRFRFTGACVQSVSASGCVNAQGRSVTHRVQTARSRPAMVLFAIVWG